MSHEIRPVRISMILLIVSGIFVYGLFWSVKGSQLSDQITSQMSNLPNTSADTDPSDPTTGGPNDIQDTDTILGSGSGISGSGSSNQTGGQTGSQTSIQDDDLKAFLSNAGLGSGSGTSSGTADGSGDSISPSISLNIDTDTTQDTINSLLKDQGIPQLSGVESYFEPVISFERLGIVPKHTFASEQEIYLGLLSTGSYDRPRIARTMKGNTVAFATEKDMIQNNLPGQRVTFINLPEYKGKLVVMVVNIDQYSWIIQIPTKIYHQSKDTLKNILGDQ